MCSVVVGSYRHHSTKTPLQLPFAPAVHDDHRIGSRVSMVSLISSLVKAHGQARLTKEVHRLILCCLLHAHAPLLWSYLQEALFFNNHSGFLEGIIRVSFNEISLALP